MMLLIFLCLFVANTFADENASPPRGDDLVLDLQLLPLLIPTTHVTKIVKECNDARIKCKSIAEGPKERLQCTLHFFTCVASKLSACGKACLVQVSMCLMTSQRDRSKMIQCVVEFGKCIISSCEKNNGDPWIPNTEIDTSLMEATSQMSCRKIRDSCLATASTRIQQADCNIKMVYCALAKLLACAEHCAPALIKCRKEGGKDEKKQLQCTQTFNQCTKDQCKQSSVKY